MSHSDALPPRWPHGVEPVRPLPSTLPDGSPWPRISVVTPSFNQGAFVEETILSVARQGYPDVEHIVIDGGSADETPAILERHRQSLAYFVSEPDRGQSHAINKGFARATGDLLTWLNSDDLLAPGALAAMALAFHTSGADLVAGVASLFSGDRFLEHHLTSCDDGPLPLGDLLDLEGCWLPGQFFYQPEVMFTRGIWERAGGRLREDLFYSMDYDLWVRFAESGAHLHVVGRPIAWYRVHGGQKTFVPESYQSELRACRDQFERRHPDLQPSSREPAPPLRRLGIVMLNDHGFHYGAGLAQQRIAAALSQAGHSVRALSLTVKPTHARTPLPSSETLLETISARDADLVLVGNLHSVGADAGVLSLVARRYPTQLVLHDLWWLTGRCAFPEGCVKYRTGCDETCPTPNEYPQLDPEAIAPAWEKKRALLADPDGPTLLAYSEWAAEFAADALAAWQIDRRRVALVSLGFPLDAYVPGDKLAAREALGLPEKGFVVLVPGDPYDRRKQVAEVIESLRRLDLPDLTVVSLGYPRENETFALPDVRRLGYRADSEQMALIYRAADVMVSASRDETLGQVFLEAISCGTPVIGYRSSGIASAIRHGVTGLLLDQPSPESLAAGILHLYENPGLRDSIAQWGRIHVENEFSFRASYRRFFCAWRRLGLTNRLRMPPKISFRANDVALPAVESLGAPVGIASDAGGEPENTYAARLSDGIDFRRSGRPSFTSRFVGFSFREEWGRWTDGPRAEIHFCRPLPRRFRIELHAGAFADNTRHSIRISAGTASAELRIELDPTLEANLPPDESGSPDGRRLPLHVVELSTSGRESVLVFEIPRPRPPALVQPGQNNDWRQLGIALQRLRVIGENPLRTWLRRITEPGASA